jgi:hypothetical protein
MSGNSHQRKMAERAARNVLKEMLPESATTSSAKERKLGRSSIEAYIFFIVGSTYAVMSAFGISVNFWVGFFLSIAVGVSATNLLWSSMWTSTWNRPTKLTGTVLIVALFMVVVNHGYTLTHRPKDEPPDTLSAIGNLAKAVSSLRDSVIKGPPQSTVQADTSRPWIQIGQPYVVPSSDKSLLLNSKVLNVGTTMAKDEMHIAGLFVAPDDERSEDAIFRWLYKREHDISPTIAHSDQLPGSDNMQIMPIGGQVLRADGTQITNDDAKALVDGTKSLYSSVLVTYKDMNGTVHHTESCFHMEGRTSNGLIRMCHGHNRGT